MNAFAGITSVSTEQKQTLMKLADALDAQINDLIAGSPMFSREFGLAIARLEEGAMWIRRAIERA